MQLPAANCVASVPLGFANDECERLLRLFYAVVALNCWLVIPKLLGQRPINMAVGKALLGFKHNERFTID